MRDRTADKLFVLSISLLVLSGIVIFISASLGLLARDGALFGNIVFNQLVFGLIFGIVACFLTARIPYQFWRRHALFLFAGAIVLNLLLFMPGLGVSHGGATRWFSIAGLSFQPSELLKLGFIIYNAAWLSSMKERLQQFRFGILPLFILISIVGAILLAQPDTDTLLVIAAAGLAMFVASGGRWRDVFVAAVIGAGIISIVAFTRPYVMDRILTFIDPGRDPLGAGYQIQQSLIAIGSGQLTGRGFGQSIQKFNFLPEPVGDSIFAVAAEEFGFLGTILVLFLFCFFATRGLKIARQAPTQFSRLLVVGIVILIMVQAFINMGAMLGLLPISGIPLPFISHGGTALLFTLASVGIIINISRFRT
jgi:cell division protein FtsW